ncbi:MAG: EpsD family peptidyl-prolyl cis-trans isomerase [Pseudomonadales bacterium]|nr:EpsD family peptidyl-prolyl cis-trans isomerase [Pseudomonadales bacterium]
MSKKYTLSLVLCLALAGCGGEESSSTATQVVAKVNGSEISVHQLNASMDSRRVNSEAALEQAKQAALKKLIDQQLAYDKAIEQGLERNPDVVMAIELAKREIISRAYMKQVVSGLSQPTPEEIHSYYEENPALFSERRIYSLQEVAVEPNDEMIDALEGFVAKAGSMDEVVEWLRERDLKFRTNAANRAAEQIGMDMLLKVAKLDAGDMAVFRGPKNHLVVKVAVTRDAPVSEDAARGRIAQFLHNLRVQKTLSDELTRLKSSSDIQYLGEFANLSGQTFVDSSSQSSTQIQASGSQVTTDSVLGETSELNIQKGLQGLQ